MVAGALARRPVRTAATVWGTLAANYGVKLLVGRERPAGGRPGDDRAAALALVSLEPRRHLGGRRDRALPGDTPPRPVWAVAAVLMCASRVYVGAHHRSDVLAGGVVGAIGGSVGARI